MATTPASVHSIITETSELITQVLDRQFKLYQDREDAREECERWKDEWEKKYRDDNNNRNRINKAFEKVNRFDGSNPDQCLPWMEEIFAMSCNHKRNAREELLSGGSIQKTLYSRPWKPQRMQFATYCYKIILILKLHLSVYLLFNLSNSDLKSHYIPTMQDTSLTTSWPMKALPLEAMGPRLAACHSLHGKLGDEMEGRFNQRLPKNLQEAFKRAMVFEPRILTKQRIHTRKVNEVNHIDVSNDYQKFKVNKAQHV